MTPSEFLEQARRLMTSVDCSRQDCEVCPLCRHLTWDDWCLLDLVRDQARKGGASA